MAKRDVVLNFIAKTNDYERRLLATGRYTEKQAAAMARKWERHLVSAHVKAGNSAKKQASIAKNAWGTALGMLSAQAIKGAVQGVAGLSQEVADYQNEINDASVRTGLATKTLAGLRLAAEGSGLSFEQLNPALVKLSKGGKDANVVFAEFQDKLGKTTTKSEAAALAASYFGEEAGPKLVQALGGTNVQLDDFITFTERYGSDLGPKAADTSARWQRTSAALDVALKGVVDRMVPLDSLLETSTEHAFNFMAGSIGIAAGLGEIGRVSGEALTGLAALHKMSLVLTDPFAGIQAKTEAINEGLVAMTKSGIQVGDAFGVQFNAGLGKALAGLDQFKKDFKAATETPGGSSGGGSGLVGAIVGDPEETIKEVTWTLETLTAAIKADGEKRHAMAQKWKADRLALNAEIAADEAALEATRIEQAEAEKARQMNVRDVGLSAATQFVSGAAGLASTLEKRRVISARAAAFAERGAAIFSIGVNTYRASMAALATVQPTVPAGIAAAGLTIGAGAAAAISVAAQPMPKFHTGTSNVGGAESMAMLSGGEAVLNPRAAEQMGRANIEAANRGTGGGGGSSAAVVYFNDRSLDRVLTRVARGDGAFPRELVAARSSITMRSPFR